MRPNSTSTALAITASTCRLIESSGSVMSRLFGEGVGSAAVGGRLGGGLAARLGDGDGRAVGEEAGAVHGDGLAALQAGHDLDEAVLLDAGLDHRLRGLAVVDEIDD